MSQPKRLHPVMLAGTGSDVGKSILANAIVIDFLLKSAPSAGSEAAERGGCDHRDNHINI